MTAAATTVRIRWLVRIAAAATALQPALASAGDAALLGCWRAQHMQVWLADGKHRDQNGDCVVEYDAASAHTRCHYPTVDIDSISAHEETGPGRLRVTALDSTTRKPKATSTEVSYQIDGRWLITTLYPTPSIGATERVDHIVNLAVRVDPERDGTTACKPRGETGLRVGRLSVSSLALKLPAGWEPMLVDPVSNRELALAINTNFFIGAFVPAGAGKSGGPPRHWVLVLDDTRYGPRPMREKDFVEVKERLRREAPAARVSCDLPDRICTVLRFSGGWVYTELFPVRGRVVTVHSSAPPGSRDTQDDLRAAAKIFVDRVRLDNP